MIALCAETREPRKTRNMLFKKQLIKKYRVQINVQA